MATCVLCGTEATDTDHGLPVCADHHGAYTQENEKFETWTEMVFSESGPVTKALLLIALEELDRRMGQAELSSRSPSAAHTSTP